MTAARKPRLIPKLAHGEGSIWWDDKRRQVTLMHTTGGKRFMERADTVAGVLAARDARREDCATVAERKARFGGNGELTFAELAAKWLEREVKGAPKTINGYRDSVRHLTGQIGDRLVADLTVTDLEDAYDALGARLAQASLVKVRSHLGMILAFGKRRGYLASNPARESQLPANLRPPVEATWLDRDQFEALRRTLAANHTTLNCALAFALLTGCRPGEVLGLHWSAIDLDRGHAKIRTALQWQTGAHHEVVDTLKTKGSKRVVELPSDLVAMLRRERHEQRQRRLAADSWADTGLVFTTSTGRAFDPSNFRRALKRYGIAALSPKSLRHSNLSWLLDAGLPTTAVSRHAGHKNTRMVTTTYGHALDDVVPTREILDRPRTVSG